MALMSRELTFILMLATSTAIGGLIKLLGQFRYKKEFMSLVGLLQLCWFCGYDTIHLLVMMIAGISLTKSTSFGPRTVFLYCFLHRLFFSSSKYFGLPRNESNLANASMFILTLKMVIVAYEVSDFRLSKKSDSTHKTKWINLDKEPSAYDLFCFMTCFAAIFTGPIYRYKTYYDMLHANRVVAIKKELISRLGTCFVLYVLFFISPINTEVYKGEFYEYSFVVRCFIVVVVVLTQVMKYAIAWLLAECICILIGLGAYPVSTKPIPGMGPSILDKNHNLNTNQEFDFETISTIKALKAVRVSTVKETLQSWNNCTQWWLAYFIYSSRIFPRNWKIARSLNVMIISSAWHGIKAGYFMSFPMLIFFLFAEDVWKKEVEERIGSGVLYKLYQLFHWLFYKMAGIAFLFTIFILQDYNEIMRFCTSMHFYGYLLPAVFFSAAMLIKFIAPQKDTPKVN